MTALLAVTMISCAVLGTITVLTREPLRQAMVAGIYGLALVVAFAVLQAPDDSLSAIVVAAAAGPLLTLLALARVRVTRERDGERASAGGEQP